MSAEKQEEKPPTMEVTNISSAEESYQGTPFSRKVIKISSRSFEESEREYITVSSGTSTSFEKGFLLTQALEKHILITGSRLRFQPQRAQPIPSYILKGW